MTDSKPHRLLVILALAGLSCGGASAPTPAVEPQVAQQPEQKFELSRAFPPRVFANDSGLTLTLIYLKQEGSSPRKALARFTGLLHPLAGLVVLVTESRHNEGRRVFWTVPYHGLNQTLATESLDTRGSASVETLLWLPETTIKSELLYDAAASRTLVPDEFFAEHRELVKQGTISALAALDRSHHQSKAEKHAKTKTASMNRSCETQIPFEIDWKSVSDEEFSSVTCDYLLDRVTAVCERDEASRLAVGERIQQIVCQVDTAFDLVLDGKVLRITVPSGDHAWPSKVSSRLRKMLDLTKTVLQNDKGEYLVFEPTSTLQDAVYYFGDGAVMHPLQGQGTILWDPRYAADVRKMKRGLSVGCSTGRVEFNPVSDEARRHLLKTARFEKEAVWKRTESALARDDNGTYYYVDRNLDKLGGKNHRLFKGPRGKVRELPLLDMVVDSDSMIFETKQGKLHIIARKKDGERAIWVQGKKKKELVMLPLQVNRELIYFGLGAYDGDDFGTICD